MITEVHDDGLLAQAAALAGTMVAIVQHSGRLGTHNEFDELIRGLEEAALEYPENIYVAALLTTATREQIAGFAQLYDEVPSQTTFNDFKMAALNRCAQAAEWLVANATPQETTEVKASILSACRRVAAASKEEGPLNKDRGDNVDDFEQSAIDEVARALGVIDLSH